MRTHPECVVAVPVRNEAKRLPVLLDALAQQRHAPSFAVCLFFDSCTDDSRSVVATLAPTLPYAVVTRDGECSMSPNAGRARAAACRLALTLSPRAILNTDADSQPAADWISANLSALDSADIVAGRIVLSRNADAPAQERLTAYYDRLYSLRRRLDPLPWEDSAVHHWTSATSLAVRSDVYRTLGGFHQVPRGEDADFADRAWRAGYRVRRDAQVVVRTSARRQGRAEGGFAATLASLDATSFSPRVAHPEAEAWRYRRHAEARACFGAKDWAGLALALHLDPDEISQVAAEVVNADAFAARIVGMPAGGMREVSLSHAEVVLDALAAELTGAVA